MRQPVAQAAARGSLISPTSDHRRRVGQGRVDTCAPERLKVCHSGSSAAYEHRGTEYRRSSLGD